MPDSNTSLLDVKQAEPTHERPATGIRKLVAPMPGTIVLCEKNVGEEVLCGDVVLILEAMKMENLITSPVTGTVLSILVKESEKVERGTVLGVIG
jgi:biotin carboxyl carrier protein